MVNEKNLYNEDELNAPKWLNNEFFVEVLRNKEVCKDIKIDNYVITPGTTKSDHYASVMFRAKVNYTVAGTAKFQSLIVKTMPEQEGEKLEVLSGMRLFETEIKMYTQTLPQIQKILKKAGDATELCCSALYHSLTPRKCIVFEDLAEKGYSTISNRWCNMEEVKAALSKVSKLHAVSFMLAKQGDKSITAYNNGSFNSINVEEFPLTANAVRLFKQVLAQHDDLKAYLPHVERIEKDLLSNCLSYFNAHSNGKRDGIMVLNHGDFHMKNMLIKTKAGKLLDLMLLDYQISIFGSAAIDVFYYFIMLLSPEMRCNNRDEINYFYFTSFQETLKAVGYDGHIPTVAEFQVELAKHKQWELFLFIAFLILNHEFSDETGDLAKMVEDESYRKQLFDSPEVLKEIRVLLPYYLHRGYFEN